MPLLRPRGHIYVHLMCDSRYYPLAHLARPFIRPSHHPGSAPANNKNRPLSSVFPNVDGTRATLSQCSTKRTDSPPIRDVIYESNPLTFAPGQVNNNQTSAPEIAPLAHMRYMPSLLPLLVALVRAVMCCKSGKLCVRYVATRGLGTAPAVSHH